MDAAPSPRLAHVVPYDPAWPDRFAALAADLRRAVGAGVVEVHHVGSTAVPGLAAKPIVDVLLAADRLDRLDAATGALAALGYRARGENGLPGRRYFVLERDGVRHAHVHGYAADHPDVRRHLVLRDYLRAHPGEAARYAACKRAHAGAQASAYAAAKAPFVAALGARARAWDAAGRP